MYQTINQHSNHIINVFCKTKDITPYLDIRSNLRQINVSENDDYQRLYRKYWSMNYARLCPKFLNHYFNKLEEYKNRQDLNFEEVARFLHKVPSTTNSENKPKENNAFQFSFATKFLHVIDPTKPIYDSNIAVFYILPAVNSKWELDRKIEFSSSIFNFLCNEYKRIINNKLLGNSIESFRETFNVDGDAYTDQRAIDSLIWKHVSLLKFNNPAEREIIYI